MSDNTSLDSSGNAELAADSSDDIIIIHDPEIDVEALMARVRANVAERRRAGAYQEDLDSIVDEVRMQVLGARAGGALTDMQQGGFPLLHELESRWLIREPDFASPAPVLGPLIVRVRRAWNWMSTKWYVRGIMDQQTAYNALVMQALAEMHRANGALSAEIDELRTTCVQQAQELAALREQIRAAQGRGDHR